jgi:hypothetical protein
VGHELDIRNRCLAGALVVAGFEQGQGTGRVRARGRGRVVALAGAGLWLGRVRGRGRILLEWLWASPFRVSSAVSDCEV